MSQVSENLHKFTFTKQEELDICNMLGRKYENKYKAKICNPILIIQENEPCGRVVFNLHMGVDESIFVKTKCLYVDCQLIHDVVKIIKAIRGIAK